MSPIVNSKSHETVRSRAKKYDIFGEKCCGRADSMVTINWQPKHKTLQPLPGHATLLRRRFRLGRTVCPRKRCTDFFFPLAFGMFMRLWGSNKRQTFSWTVCARQPLDQEWLDGRCNDTEVSQEPRVNVYHHLRNNLFSWFYGAAITSYDSPSLVPSTVSTFFG